MSLTVVTALCHAQGARTQSVSRFISVVCVFRTFVTVLRELTRIYVKGEGARAPSRSSRAAQAPPIRI